MPITSSSQRLEPAGEYSAEAGFPRPLVVFYPKEAKRTCRQMVACSVLKEGFLNVSSHLMNHSACRYTDEYPNCGDDRAIASESGISVMA